MAVIAMPRVPQAEMCLLVWQRAQSRLGVRDCDCSKSDVCCYHPEGDGIIQACRTDLCHQSDNADEAIEQIDEDIAVTQSQMNFICPITQMEMKRPVRNKVCGHIYEEDAILKIIQTRKQQKKKVRCPKIGCSHADVKGSDLVPDEALKRAIDSHNKQVWPTLEKSAGYAAATEKICC
ncbi:PREDICTED: E3 SUMO-protein ligase NSE2 [Pterocles gutturalis]|uniref:E3 SUMO-protein ligase NSE2 n=1 Tax=Pterocles gutturalis TaxID=240206 RepID=UPI00052804A0|nr:PREDICTED: E3 SUMO-protein ligase NSE2 [Pterocles gutturalis]